MVDTGFVLSDIGQPMLLKQKRKQELNLFWQLFALSRGFLPSPKAGEISEVTRHPRPAYLILKFYRSPSPPRTVPQLRDGIFPPSGDPPQGDNFQF